MAMNRRLFTSESVTEGHPDKICDQTSDAILDEILKKDPNARVACETTVTTGLVLVSGEITTTTYVDIPSIVRETISEIGYTRAKYGFDAETCAVLTSIDEQSPDIADGVDRALEIRDNIDENEELGAGDQGLMFGFACDETEELIPLPIFLAHRLARKLAEVRKDGTLPYLRPDGKTQVTIEYDEKNRPVKVDTIVISTQHSDEMTLEQIEKDLQKYVVEPIVPSFLLDESTKYFYNPSGRFVIGGPQGDTGLTGRKIIVDTYGGYARHGGGAFSGKDGTKVDRSGAYAARYVAKNIVAADLATTCEVQIAYAIGVAEPVSIAIDTYGTGKVSEELLEKAIRQTFDLKPTSIIETLQLKRPLYRQIASYGHFGRHDLSLPWEQTDKIMELRNAVLNSVNE